MGDFEPWARAYNVAPLNSMKRTCELLGGCGKDLIYGLVKARKLTIRKLNGKTVFSGEEIYGVVRELPAADQAA